MIWGLEGGGVVRGQGRTQGEGPGAAPPPLGPENTIFSGFLPLNYVIYIFEVCFLCFLLCGRTEEACSMVNSLRKVDFPTLLATIHGKKFAPPLEKIMVAPLYVGINLGWRDTSGAS